MICWWFLRHLIFQREKRQYIASNAVVMSKLCTFHSGTQSSVPSISAGAQNIGCHYADIARYADSGRF